MDRAAGSADVAGQVIAVGNLECNGLAAGGAEIHLRHDE
jgi:hypothetical protein